MKALSRSDFEHLGNLSALDYAAQLVFATASMWQARAEFKNIRSDGDEERGNQILRACQAAAAALVAAATAKDPALALQQVRSKHLGPLIKATLNAKRLARAEQEHTGGSSQRVLTQHVLAPLLSVARDWGASKSELAVD